MDRVKVGFVQPLIRFGERRWNVENALKLASKIGDSELIVLPELLNTGYAFKSREEALEISEPVPRGESTDALIRFTEKNGNCIVAGLAEKVGGDVYNSAVVIWRGKVLGTYRKMHLFFKEKIWFDPGNTSFQVFDVEGLRVGVMICFDWIFPEASRTLAAMGADVIAHPSNLILPYAQEAMLTRSIENRVYTVTANRLGVEERGGNRFEFTGRSQMTTPGMKLIYRASNDREEAYSAPIDLEKARDKRITELNHLLEDRRPEKYLL